jgi:mercuric ion binding protein
MKKLAAMIALAAAFSVPAFAANKTVALSVSNMTCAACPITVKKALTNVPGVQSAEVSYEKKEAAVTYDDAKTSVEALIKATEGAGYPSQVKK